MDLGLLERYLSHKNWLVERDIGSVICFRFSSLIFEDYSVPFIFQRVYISVDNTQEENRVLASWQQL